MKNIIYILIFFITSLLFYSCGGNATTQEEGQIEYKITYPKMDKKSFMLDFMPRKMVMKFKEDVYSTNLSAGMGMFRSSFICDKNNNQFIQQVKLINKKYALKLDEKGIKESISKNPSFTIEHTTEIKNILGYNCKKAIITVNNEKQDAFIVFYTDKIGLKSPNWCNEFAEIDGVMLEYQYEKYDVCMRFTASKIEFKEIDDKEFEISKDYKLISEEQMDKEMREIFESFN